MRYRRRKYRTSQKKHKAAYDRRRRMRGRRAKRRYMKRTGKRPPSKRRKRQLPYTAKMAQLEQAYRTAEKRYDRAFPAALRKVSPSSDVRHALPASIWEAVNQELGPIHQKVRQAYSRLIEYGRKYRS